MNWDNVKDPFFQCPFLWAIDLNLGRNLNLCE